MTSPAEPLNPRPRAGWLVLALLAGQIVGINTLAIRSSDAGGAATQGLGFAIPANTARAIVNQMVERGQVRRPYLGIRSAFITPEVAARNQLPVDYGAHILEVVPGASRSGRPAAA